MRFDFLEGFRVVEIGSMWAAPYAARILGDFGAEVIKLESPRKPEPVRFGFYAGGNDPGDKPWERGGHFGKFGRNKKSLILDITSGRGRELLYELLRKVDVLVENNTPRVRANLGLNHEVLREEAPNLVAISMPGFGESGPYRDYLAFGIQMEGFGGITAATGYPGTAPIRSAIPYGDPVAAIYGAMAAIAGLRTRKRTGTGACYEVNQHEGLLSLVPDLLLESQITGLDPVPAGNADPLLYAFQAVSPAADGTFVAVSVTADLLEPFTRLIGTSPDAGRDAQIAAFARYLAGSGAAAAIAALQSSGIASGPALSPGQMMAHEQVLARGVYAPVEHPVAGTIPYAQIPLHFHGAPNRPDLHAPLFGEHNRELFATLLGLSESEIDELYRLGITTEAPVMG